MRTLDHPLAHRLLPALRFEVNGCISFTGQRHRVGYGVTRDGKGGKIYAHRLAYEMFIGPIPAGMVIDHTCHNDDSDCPGGDLCPHRLCVNPRHLRAVTAGENVLASGVTRASINAAKTHCPKGHPLSGDNLYVRPGKETGRGCRQCRRDASRRRFAAGRFGVAMLALLASISLQLPASASREPIDNRAREAWHELGEDIEAGAAYATAVAYSQGAMACPLPEATFVDSWGAPRAGHTHLGVDMMAPDGATVLAPASGTYRQHGTESFYLEAVDGTLYFGTHLSGHLHADGPVVAGEPVAVNSNTGNASGGAAHLHLQIAPDGETWENPYPATLAACSRPAPVLATARAAQPRAMPRVTADQVRFCRFTTAGIGAPFVACLHEGEGHHQGMRGHLWADYRRQARQFHRFLQGFSPRTCSGPSDCPALIRAAFDHMGVGWRGSEAVTVATCESGLNPTATNGSHDGLFQQARSYWAGRSTQYGMGGRSAYDPWANAVVSAGMVRDTGGWSHWSCGPG